MLALGAHPDDLEVGAGGLIARLAATADVLVVVASIPNRFEERLAEAREGAARLGARLTVLEPTRASRVDERPQHVLSAQLEAIVDEHAPELVITHAVDDMHADHITVHRATIAGSTFGGSALMIRSACVGLRLEFVADGTRYVTSRIQTISRYPLRGCVHAALGWPDRLLDPVSREGRVGSPAPHACVRAAAAQQMDR